MRDETETFRVLAVDDEIAQLNALRRLLATRGFEILPFTDPEPALAILAAERDRIDLVLLDRHLSADTDGLDVLLRARAIAPDVPCIILTGDVSDSTAATALRNGAFHFLTKPITDLDAVVLTLLRACNYARLQRRTRVLEHKIAVAEQFEHLVGASTAMREVFETISRIAEADFGVLIQGESGTGKELTARAIHNRSTRAAGPFVALNCGAIPEMLIDSELFGHARGAFTGATEARPGVFVEAHGGTLFLDEVGELPLAVQARLLRVLQEHEVRAVGATGTRKVDVRTIAATHVDLERSVEEGRFRTDLFYRLNVLGLRLPPLRERGEDIPILAGHLLDKYSAKMRRPVPLITPTAIEALCRHAWPGNVRELENVILRALTMTRGDELGANALPAALLTASPQPDPVTRERVTPHEDLSWSDALSYREAHKQAIDRFDRGYVLRALARGHGNLSEAARLARIDRSNFRRILSRVGIKRLEATVAVDATAPADAGGVDRDADD